MKIEYRLKDNSVVYKIKNASDAYVCADVCGIFFKDEKGFSHDVKLSRKEIVYFFCGQEKREIFTKEKSINDIVEAARRCRYDVNNCVGCPFLSEDPDCYKRFMNAIINILGGHNEN